MAGSPVRVLLAVLSAGLVALTAGATAPVVASERESGRHVLFLSVDGLHQSDLTWYVNHHPNSALASLVKKGVEFTEARTPAAADFAKDFLQHHSGTGNDINGNPKPYTSSGLAHVYAGADAAAFMHVRFSDARVPDLIGVAQIGSVYTGKQGKIAEHGGNNPQDRSVPLVVSGRPIEGAGNVVNDTVETTQIAPTILQLLGLNPQALKAVQIEHTDSLPLSGS